MTAFTFDARTVQPDTGVGDPVPAGWYIVSIDETDIKPTNDGLGAYLQARFNVLDGAHKGRKLFSRFNIKNSNPQAVEIAYKQLSALQHAINVLQVHQDTSELHNIPLKVKVSLRPGNVEKDPVTGAIVKQYEPSNDIKAYRNVNEVTDASPSPAAAAMPPPGYAPAAPPQQAWAPPAAQPPAAPPQWAPPAAQQPPAAWAPPPQAQAAPQQPWAQPAQPQAAPPAAAPAQQPAAAPPWAPPAAGGAPQANVPPWAQQPAR